MVTISRTLANMVSCGVGRMNWDVWSRFRDWVVDDTGHADRESTRGPLSVLTKRPRKASITIRIDADVLAMVEASGGGIRPESTNIYASSCGAAGRPSDASAFPGAL